MKEHALLYGCEYCGVGPGAHCVSRKSGKRASYPHSERFEGVRQAWYEGYLDGRGDVAQEYLDALDPEYSWLTIDRFEERVAEAVKEAAAQRG